MPLVHMHLVPFLSLREVIKGVGEVMLVAVPLVLSDSLQVIYQYNKKVGFLFDIDTGL